MLIDLKSLKGSLQVLIAIKHNESFFLNVMTYDGEHRGYIQRVSDLRALKKEITAIRRRANVPLKLDGITALEWEVC